MRILLLLALFALPLLGVHAQTVSGTITDNDDLPVIGATILIVGTSSGTTTDLDGQYTVTAKDGDVLRISYTGFSPQDVTVDGPGPLDIKLTEGIDLDAVTVVGSRGKPRTSYDAAVPVDNISAATLESSGRGVLDQQLMFKVPSYNSTQQPISDAAAHFSPADLRGMGPSRTLVLVNGKRKNASALVYSYVTPGRGEVGVDMKSVPSAAIERVEILRDGAAAQYGSDAVAGVINLVLKKKTDPFVNLGYSVTGEGDGEQISLDAGFGVNITDKGFANFTVGYFDQKRSQRAGEITSVADEAGYWGVTDDSDFNTADLTALLGREPSAGFQVGLPDMTINSFAFNSGFTLDEATETEVYLFGNLASRDGSAPQFARVPYWVPGFDAIYPDNTDFFLAEMSPQILDHSVTLGLRTVRNGWNFDLSSTMGKNRIDYYITNSFNQSFAGSSPSDFYNGAHQFSHMVNNFDISRIYERPSGASYTLAVGAEQRTERFETEAGEFASYGDGENPNAAGGRTGSESFGGFTPDNESINFRNNIGVYTELTADFTPQFLLGGALRFENYSDFGNNLSWKLNSRYKFAEGKFNVRASVSNGFRAPSLHQIYYTAITTTLTANGIVENGILGNNDPALRALGIPELQPETSFNLGVGFTARLGNSVGLTVDAYQINVDDRIVLSGQVTQTGDAASPIDQLLDNVGVGSAGFFLNAISTTTQGVDVVLNFTGIDFLKGRLSGSLAGNFNNVEVDSDINTSDFIEQNNLTSNIFTREDISRVESWRPRSKIVATATHKINKLSSTLSFLYYGSVTYLANNELDDATYGGKLLTDLTFSYDFTDKLALTVGANNIFDVYPDTFADVYEGGAPQDRNLDFVGRFKYPWQTTQFGIDGRRVFTKLAFQF
ncbi:TonB-dependent receptor [Neolewinella antarctica]|uniref:Iron complex outermembrane receptor protein n=1 Tax=Neolewinella antarctica TaxID=442734 RepID=A0ABX0XAS9_9BACT|nr:TonB-dependent receptor [Neolewinella antarctica]NJC26059.1 iron complex outermembrane receptor protein [Neolewinella antarctica]